jgi:hypothetical protein
MVWAQGRVKRINVTVGHGIFYGNFKINLTVASDITHQTIVHGLFGNDVVNATDKLRAIPKHFVLPFFSPNRSSEKQLTSDSNKSNILFST